MAVYVIANITYLLNFDGVYWDGWVVYNHAPSTLTRFFGEIMNTTHGYFSIVMSELWNGVYSFRLAYFVMYFTTALLIYAILTSVKIVDKNHAFWITLLYLVAPGMETKVTIAVIPFYFPVTIFFIAWYWLSRTVVTPNRVHDIGILCLFFISFTTNSLLVLYGLVIIYIFYKQNLEGGSSGLTLRTFREFLFRNFFFLLVPVLFFVLKTLFLRPNGLYEGYNSLSISSVWYGLSDIPKAIYKVTVSSYGSVINDGWLFGLLFIAIFIFIQRKSHKLAPMLSMANMPLVPKNILLICVGLLGILFAVIPYLAVGKVPADSGWGSRFQLVALLPVSFTLVFLLTLLSTFLEKLASKAKFDMKPEVICAFLLVFTVGCSAGKILSDQHDYNVDWFYQTAMKEQFAKQPIIQDHNTFIVTQHACHALVNNRHFRIYEWNGLLREAFGNAKRFMISDSSRSRLDAYTSQLRDYKQYNFYEWEKSAPVVVSLTCGPKPPSSELVKLYWLNLTDRQRFKAATQNLVAISRSDS